MSVSLSCCGPKSDGERYLYSFVLLGKHCSKDGSSWKSGELGSTVCFLCFPLSALVAGGSKVNVALGPELRGGGHNSFLYGLETRPTASNPDKKAVLGNFAGEELFPFLHTTDVRVLWTDAISRLNKVLRGYNRQAIKLHA